MAAKNVTIKGFQLRHDTAANWRSKNPTLRAGEVGIETDNLQMKVGNGETTWNSLAYANTQDLSEYLLTSAATSTYATKADTYTKTEVDNIMASAIADISVANNTLTWTKGDGTTGSFDLGNIKWG